MKKILITSLTLSALILIAGCQQADQLKSDAEKIYDDTSKTAGDLTNQAIETKEAVEEKAQQAQEAADALKKLAE